LVESVLSIGKERTWIVGPFPSEAWATNMSWVVRLGLIFVADLASAGVDLAMDE
jgi:hypothetical protein